MKKDFKWDLFTSSLVAVAFYAVCGVLLLVLPTKAIAIANYAIAFLLAVAGAVCVFSYFKASILAGVLGIRLALGLILICFAVLMFCYPTFLAQLLPAIWGLSLLMGGFGKLQMTFDLKRMGEPRWWLMLIGAALSFLLGVTCLVNPIVITAFITQFIGISLLVEAALDLASFLAVRRRMKEFQNQIGEQ